MQHFAWVDQRNFGSMYLCGQGIIQGIIQIIPCSVCYIKVQIEINFNTVQISRNVAPTRTRGFARGLIIAQKRAVSPVSLADITKHTQGCTLRSETGATPPSLVIIKP